jgi:TolA-binding protein
LKKIVYVLFLLLAIPAFSQQTNEPTVTELKAQIAQLKLQVLQLQSAFLQCQAPQIQQEVQNTQNALRVEQEKKKPIEKKLESKEVKPTAIK